MEQVLHGEQLHLAHADVLQWWVRCETCILMDDKSRSDWIEAARNQTLQKTTHLMQLAHN